MDQEDLEFYRLNKPVFSCSSSHRAPIDIIDSTATSTDINSASSMFRSPVVLVDDHDHKMLQFQRTNKASDDDDQLNHLMKTQIANHPAYPDLLAAYIQCQMVGAPAEMAVLLEEIVRENHMMMTLGLGGCSTQIGDDPELDYFMESYCGVLQRSKEELSKSFNEATTFLSNIESQLSDLCEGTFTKTLDYYDHLSDETGGTNPDEQKQEEIMIRSYGDQVDHDHWEISRGVGQGAGDYYHQGLKEKLLRKYSGYLTMLKTEFLKKRKKIELPKPARTMLLHWWNSHSRWPYPTEEEKAKLSEETGLDQKQINNWFVNQRKRHWKPTEDIKCALINDPST